MAGVSFLLISPLTALAQDSESTSAEATAQSTMEVLAATQDVTADLSFTSYARSEYYLGEEGKPPTLAELAENPKGYFRHGAAYEGFKALFVPYLPADAEDQDAALAAFLADETKVEAVDCKGRLETQGINLPGQTDPLDRACYKGEQVIRVKVDGNIVASLGCLNPVSRMYTPAPPAKKVVKQQLVRKPAPATVDRRPAQAVNINGLFVPGSECCDGCDIPSVVLPGQSIVIPGGVSVTGDLNLQ